MMRPSSDRDRDASRPQTAELRSPSIEVTDAGGRSLRIDTDVPRPQASPPVANPQPLSRSDTAVHRGDISPNFIRQRQRAMTFRTVEDFDDLETDNPQERPGWQPGSEPGYDPKLPDGGHASRPTLSAPCQITVVDFSSNNVDKKHFENQSFIDFLEQPKPNWARCRWINVNGLSWDVIQAIGSKKGLHKLALEDVMNVRNRTKADWYPNHAFVVMTLQKLVHLVEEDDDGTSSTSSNGAAKSFGVLRESFKDLWRSKKEQHQLNNRTDNNADVEKESMSGNTGFPLADGSVLHETQMMRTLQRYHSSGNEARTEFMERHSSLAPYKMAVSAEQVSIFLTSDNTVISFFEFSAGDIERPIVTRLSTSGTILRQSYDGSLLVQAIIDAIIDLAIPLTAIYTDIIGDLELDVLMGPRLKQSRSLYITISEINKMLSFLNPIDNLVNLLRDHKTDLPQNEAMKILEDPSTGVIISPMTHTYLGDVLDHCIIITENLHQLKKSSDNLINLIFNTISNGQNESMKQLTAVTIIFLPLTFITGFFGQNFVEEGFPELQHGIWYFWACAVPTAFLTALVLMRAEIYNSVVRIIQRRHVLTIRKNKRRRQDRARALTRDHMQH